MRGLSPVAASVGHSSSRCAGLSLSRPLLLRSTGSRRAGSVIVAHGPSRPTACGILPDEGSNPRALHQQADSQPLRHQGNPYCNSFHSTSHSLQGPNDQGREDYCCLATVLVDVDLGTGVFRFMPRNGQSECSVAKGLE